MVSLEIMGDRPRPYVMAHRGNSALCPENTLAAFRQAIDDGADIIETDLHVSADGVLVCIHDDTVDRTTDGKGAVREMPYGALQALSASYGRPEFVSERIPALRDLLQILPAETGVGLELKSDDFLDQQVCLALLAFLRETGTLNRVVALSFSRERLRAIQRYTPEIPVGLITLMRFFPEREWTLTGPLWPVMFLNPLYTWIARRRGQIVCPLDPTPDSRLWYYRLLRCDAVLSNDPGQTRRRLHR
jgi:glycerophosphoryl diester phosphodiesterase